MRLVFSSCILLALLVSSPLFAVPKESAVSTDDQSRRDYVSDELLVKFNPQTNRLAKSSFIAEVKAQRDKGLPISRLHLLKLPRDADARVMAELYASDPRIEYAQPNYVYYTQVLPDDTDYNNLWGLKNIGQTIVDPVYGTNNPGTPGNDMNAETAWDEQTDCRNTVVAVLDTGINYTHEDLAGNMWQGGTANPNHGYDFVDHDDDPLPSAGESHGSHVAGTIGAVGNNARGTTGVCWQAEIMSVRVLGPGGSGTTASIIEGVDFAVNQGAKIINMSLGGTGGSEGDALSEAISNAGDAGAIVVASAGNGGSDGIADNNDVTPFYPCNYTAPNIICVAALDQGYELTSFSNYGRESVDVGAPGANIKSAVAGSVVTEDFSGWTRTGDWGIATTEDLFCSAETVPSLVNPSDFCESTAGPYANNADDVAYQVFNLSAPVIGAGVHAYVEYFMAVNDTFAFAVDRTGGNPFGTPIIQDAGNSVSPARRFSYDLTKSSCLTTSCSIGFRVQSDASGTDWGARVFGFHVNTTIDGAATYSLLNGTSMAAPHVTGLAALVWSYNPGYTYADVISSVVNSGDLLMALDSITTEGRAVDAYKALRYIQAPTGVSARID